MRASEAPARYTRTAIALHWLIAILVVTQFAWGWWMLSIPKQPAGVRADAFNLHKSIGLTILALMMVRLAWRVTHPAPALPEMPRWQTWLARSTHVALYAALLIQPFAGYLGSVFSGYPVKYFGMTLPAWGVRHEGLKDFLSIVHLCTSFAIATLVLLHVAGAAKHALVERDGLLARMGLGRRRAA